MELDSNFVPLLSSILSPNTMSRSSATATTTAIESVSLEKTGNRPTMSRSPHILVYPFPASGHIIPFLDLTRHLLSRGLTVTVLLTPPNLSLLDPLLSSQRLHPLVIPATPQPPITIHSIMRAFHHHHYPAVLDWFKSHDSPPVAILSDFFLGWTQHLASELRIQRVVFSPSGAFAYSVLTSLWTDMPRNDSDSQNDMDFAVSFPSIPDSPTFPWWQLSNLFRSYKQGDPDSEFLKETLLANSASWGILFNSFAELETTYLDHMKSLFGNDRVWAVGPLLPSDEESTAIADRGGLSSVPCQEVLTWLDGKKRDSVVYVCFGSRGVLTRHQMEELAAALDRSGVSFIWSIRDPNQGRPTDDHGELADDYEDRVRGRGFIIKGWAPQVAILKHEAVAAFVTHCGWNSVLEGISAGVVLLTWPLCADQFSNARLVVDELGVGIRVGEDTVKIPTADVLAGILLKSVGENLAERVKVKKLQAAAANATGEGGSSYQDLDAFVMKLNDLRIGSSTLSN